jgi:hypothetical protein
MKIYQAAVNVQMQDFTTKDPIHNTKTSKTEQFRKTFPDKYIAYQEALPDFMAFDQTPIASDRGKKTALAKEFITKNRDRMWMFHVSYVGKSHKEVLGLMLSTPNFNSLLDDLTFKERKFNRGSGSAAVGKCLTMAKELIVPELQKDDWLATLHESRTSRERRMNHMFSDADSHRIQENNRASAFKGF